MAIYIDEKNRIKDIFINVDGEKKKVTSVWCDKNSVPTKVFSHNTSSLDVSWANGTIEEISKILDMHYAGEIDISEHWRVGDERVVHLSAMSSWDSTYGEAQPEQDVTLVIIGLNFDTLRNQINECSKAAITVQVKNCLQNQGVIDANYIEYGERYKSCTLEWVACDRRTWCNNTFKNSLPNEISNLIKIVKKSNYYIEFSGSPINERFTKVNDNLKTPNNIYDSCFLLSTSETGLHPVSMASEPAYPYFDNKINRAKNVRWWTRDPSYTTEICTYLSWSDITAIGNEGGQFIKNQGGIAPAFCL